MRKIVQAILALFVCTLPAVAQIPSGYVQTTATVPSLANGTYGAAWTNLSSSPQLALLGCVSTFQQTVNGNFDANGHFSVLLADTAQICPSPSTWTFTLTYSCPKLPNTAFMVQVPVTGGGATEDISAQIIAALPASPCGGSTPTFPITIPEGGTGATTAAGAYANIVAPNLLHSIKEFGCAGDGTTDDTTCLTNALAYALANKACIYFPAGAYKTTAQLNWTSQQRLCLRGVTPQTSYIIYEGTSSITAGVNIATGTGAGVQFDIDGLGFATNANALYAFYSYFASSGATTNNVAFAGGSSSAVRNDFFNSEGDQRNWQVGTGFTPSGASSCVNGITFGAGSSTYGQAGFPSSQFTMTMPKIIGGCSGTALNLLSVANSTWNNGQINCNGQQMLLGDENNSPSTGNTFNTLLLENCSSTTLPVQIYGYNNTFTSLGESDLGGTPSGDQGIFIYGSNDHFKGGYFAPKIQPPGSCLPPLACAATGNDFDGNVFQSGPGFSDAGIGTTGKNNSVDDGSFTSYVLLNSWNRETPADSSSLIGSPPYSQSPVRVPWSLSVVGNGVYPITAALKISPSPNYWRAFIDGGFGQNTTQTGDAQGYEVNDFNNNIVTLADGTTITFANNQTDGEFEATVANNTIPISFYGWVTIFPGGYTGDSIAPFAMTYNSAVSFLGGWSAQGTLNAQNAYWLGAGSAPVGSCLSYQPTGSWVFSQDGEISYCNAGTWTLFSAGSGAFSGGLGASYQDVTEIAAPADPTSGNDRLYLDSTTHLFTCLTSGGGSCLPSGGGGVSSVGLTVPSWLTVAGSPVTSSGTLAVAPTTAQTSHQVIGTCGTATTFGPCTLVAGDLPIGISGLTSGQVAIAGSASTITSSIALGTSGSDIPQLSGGLLAASILPKATTSAFGAVEGDASTLTLTSGVISCTTATTSQIGCAKPDGSTITISGGVITAVGSATPNALTMNNSGSGAASGAIFNGSAGVTLSYNTLGAAPALGNATDETTSWSIVANSNYRFIGSGASNATTPATTGVTGISRSINVGTANVTVTTGGPTLVCNPVSCVVPVGAGFIVYTDGTDQYADISSANGAEFGTLANANTINNSNWSGTVLASDNGGTGIGNTATLTLGTSNQNWATLATGIVKNTTTTGALSAAAAADVIALWSGSCSSSTYLNGAGACGTPTGFANPMTTLGDVIYGGASGVATRLPGPTSSAGTYFLIDVPTTTSAVAETFSVAATGTGAPVLAASPALTGTPDASGATQFKLPVASSFASAANGETGYDTTNKNWHLWGNGVDNFNVIVPVSTSITNGHCSQWALASGTLTLVDAGSSCGSDSGGGTSGWSGTPLTFISTATQYAPPVGGSLTSATESVADVASPVAQTISNLSVSLSAALGAGATLQVTFRDGGVSEALTCTTASGGASCVDSTHSFNVAKGDLIDFQLISSGTVTAGVPQIVITYAAGTSSVGVTSIATTGPITGGPITSTGTIACATCLVATVNPSAGLLRVAGSTQTATGAELSGDATTSGSNAVTVVKINGGAMPTSAALLASNGSAQPTAVTVGTGVITAAGINGGSAGALGVLIATGTAAMNTSAIASGACATVVTVAGSGIATTDVIEVGFNGDPTAVTGYGASATGAVLTIYPYPTSGNVNIKVCNSSASSITPSALTLNWKVYR